jgi:hypothetical protein
MGLTHELAAAARRPFPMPCGSDHSWRYSRRLRALRDTHKAERVPTTAAAEQLGRYSSSAGRAVLENGQTWA